MSSAEFKALGNQAFSSKNFPEAIKYFTKALELEDNYVFYSNRSASYASLKQWDNALKDANDCISRNPNWSKGYSRKSAALHGMGKFDEAISALQAGLAVDPTNESLKESLNEVRLASIQSRRPPMPNMPNMPNMPANPFANMFGPDMERKLATNPKTASFVNDAAFMAKLRSVGQDPSSLLQSMMNPANSDPRIATAFQVLMGIDDKNLGDLPQPPTNPFAPKPAQPTTTIPKPTQPSTSTQPPTSTPNTTSTTTPKSTSASNAAIVDSDDEEIIVGGQEDTKLQKTEDKKMVDEPAQEEEEEYIDEELEREKLERTPQIKTDPEAAEKEKAVGTEFYKKRDFEEAIKHYEAAFELDPTNPVYKLNLSAVAFEQKRWEATVKYCDEASQTSQSYRKNRLTTSQLSKLYLRQGNAYSKLGKYEDAIDSYKKSLLEEHTNTAKNALRVAQQDLRDYQEKQYLDPVKSEEAKEQGNEYFKEGKWNEAINCYTEAIKRNPDNYKVYSNRAACYTKIMQWDRGLKDCEKCLEIDPSFVKAYIRKGKIQHFLKQYPQAIDTFTAGLNIDPNCEELLEALRLTRETVYKANTSTENDEQRLQEGLRDPGVQAILNDPQMNIFLKELQENPNSESVQRQLRDPKYMAALDKLSAAGIIRFG